MRRNCTKFKDFNKKNCNEIASDVHAENMTVESINFKFRLMSSQDIVNKVKKSTSRRANSKQELLKSAT